MKYKKFMVNDLQECDIKNKNAISCNKLNKSDRMT